MSAPQTLIANEYDEEDKYCYPQHDQDHKSSQRLAPLSESGNTGEKNDDCECKRQHGNEDGVDFSYETFPHNFISE